MAEELNIIERRSRAYSIRVLGVPAEVSKQTQHHRKLVADILLNNNLTPYRDVDEITRTIEIAHPLGKPINGKVNYIARFFARPIREEIVRQSKIKRDQLRGAEWIVDDLTKLDLQLKKAAKPLMDKAYSEGKRVRFQNGKLIVEGREVKIPNQ